MGCENRRTSCRILRPRERFEAIAAQVDGTQVGRLAADQAARRDQAGRPLAPGRPLARPPAQPAGDCRPDAGLAVDRGWGRAEHAAAQPAASAPPEGRPFQPGETGNADDPCRAERRVRRSDRAGPPPRRDPPRLDDAGSRSAVRPAVLRPAVRGAARAPRAARAEHGADEHAAVDQDRRLPRGLRLLPAERALRHRPRTRAPARRRGSARARHRGARRRRDPLLHGRRLALAEGARHRDRRGDDPRGARARPRVLRDARHADAGAGAAAEVRGPRLLQPQHRHLARVLRRRSSRPAISRTGSTRSRRCATRA